MNNRVLWIDNLKGVLCLIVFFFHYISTFNSLTGFESVDSLLREGGYLHILVDGVFAVKLFLIISAYAISKSITNGKNLGDIIIKRYFRLAVPVGIACILAFLLQHFYYVDKIELSPSQEWVTAFYPHYSISLLVKNLFFSVVCGYNEYLGVAWMLKYIFWGTFLTIIIKEAIRGRDIRTKIGVLVMFFCISYAVDAHYALISIGVAIEEFQKYTNKVRMREVFSIIMIAFGIGLHYYNRLGFISVVAATLIMIGLFIGMRSQTILSSSHLQCLGKVSFSLYLIHCPIIFSLTSFAVWHIGGGNNVWILLMTILSVLAFSYLFNIIIEKKVSNIIINKIVSFLK